jgi:hypothetical protein
VARHLGKKLLLACLTITVLATLSGLSQAAHISGTTLTNAVKALRSAKPAPAEQKALDSAIESLTREHFARLGINPQKASQELWEQFKGISRLTLRVVATVTEPDPAALKKLTLDDLMAITGVVMAKMKEMRPSDADLQDERYVTDIFIPAVIDTIAKSR